MLVVTSVYRPTLSHRLQERGIKLGSIVKTAPMLRDPHGEWQHGDGEDSLYKALANKVGVVVSVDPPTKKYNTYPVAVLLEGRATYNRFLPEELEVVE